MTNSTDAAGDTELAELHRLCPGAERITDGGFEYVYLPRLGLPVGCNPECVEALLRRAGPDGYVTRLFLSVAFPGKGQNWTVHRIADKTWHSFSYNGVPPELRLVDILANHLGVLR